MWRSLREAFPGWRFRRQVPFGRYLADFCSHQARLVIEVDGDSHAATQAYDVERTRFLEDEGYRVMRFSNADVLGNVDGVVAAIATRLSQTTKGAAHG